MPHRIAQEYNNMKLLFSRSALSDDVTRKFISINELCKTEIARMHVLPITSGSTAVGKNYMVFSLTGNIVDKHSRPVNSDLYNAGNQLDATGKTKVYMSSCFGVFPCFVLLSIGFSASFFLNQMVVFFTSTKTL